MSKIGKLFSSMIVLALFISMSSSAFASGSKAGPIQVVSVKCETAGQDSINLTDVEGEVKLNGTTVDSVDCSKLEAYDYSDSYYNSQSSSRIPPSIASLLLVVLLPGSVLFASALVIGRRYSVERSELGKILGTSVGLLSLLGVTILFLSGNSGVLANVNRLMYILMVSGPLMPSLATYYRWEQKGIEDKKVAATIAFLFSIMLYWIVWAYLASSYVAI